MKRILDVDFDVEDSRSLYKKKMKVVYEDESDVETVTYKEADDLRYISDSDIEANREDDDVNLHEIVTAIDRDNLQAEKVTMSNLVNSVPPKVKKTKKNTL